MGRRDFEEDWEEILGWRAGDTEPASIMLRITHLPGGESLIVKEVFLVNAPKYGDYLDSPFRAKIISVHEMYEGLIVGAEADFDGTESELVRVAIGDGWEFLSIDHEMN